MPELGTARQGAFFGEIAVLYDMPRTATVPWKYWMCGIGWGGAALNHRKYWKFFKWCPVCFEAHGKQTWWEFDLIWFDYFIDPIHSRRCNVVMSHHPDSTYVFFSMNRILCAFLFDYSLSTHISPWWPGANADGRHRSSAQSRWYPRAADDGGAVDTAVLSVSN